MIANIIRSRSKTAIGGGGGGIVIDNGDPFYSAVSMLLPMDGTNGSTTFTDSGPNAIAVTASGNAQISTTQSKYGGASGYFDGAGDYLSISPSTAIDLSSSDFTIEFWIRPAPKTNAVDAAFGYSNYACMFYHNGINWTLEMSSTGFSNQLVISFAVTLNTWQHIAIVRSGTSVVVYKDGVSSASGTFTGTVATSGRTLRIGDNGNSQNINGYMDDFRISQFARYVSSFTPPTAALPTTASSTPADPYYGNTSLLLHMDGTNASTNFVDSGPNALAVTASGNAQITTTQSKFGGASGSFNGTNAFLSPGSASASQFDFGTGDFTIEGWFYFNSFGGANYAPLFANSYLFYVGASGEVLVFNGSSNVVTGTAGNVSLNSWTHIAYSRSGSTLRVFVNGIQKASATVSASIGTSASNYIGRYGSVYLNAYIDDLRVTKYARYTSAFASPAQAHLEFANGNDRHFSNVSLLLHMDGANGSTTFTDNSANALAITRTGTAAISTAQSQFGGASCNFPGTSCLSAASSSIFSVGTGDFTVEAWVNFTVVPSSGISPICQTDAVGTSTNNKLWIGYTSGQLRLGQHSTSNGAYCSWTPSAGTWYHIAVQRKAGTVSIYINGVAQTVTNSTIFSATTFAQNGFVVGGISTPSYFQGYIDDFRFTNTVARYSGTFTPPESAHPNS